MRLRRLCRRHLDPGRRLSPPIRPQNWCRHQTCQVSGVVAAAIDCPEGELVDTRNLPDDFVAAGGLNGPNGGDGAKFADCYRSAGIFQCRPDQLVVYVNNCQRFAADWSIRPFGSTMK